MGGLLLFYHVITHITSQTCKQCMKTKSMCWYPSASPAQVQLSLNGLWHWVVCKRCLTTRPHATWGKNMKKAAVDVGWCESADWYTIAKTHPLKTGVETHNQRTILETTWRFQLRDLMIDDVEYSKLLQYISIQPTNNLGVSTHGPRCLGRSPPRAWRATRRWAPWGRRRRRCRRGAVQCSCLGWKSSQVKLQRWGYGCVWKWLVPRNPMVLLIIIPMKNGYFIGNIPYFQTNPYGLMIWVNYKLTASEPWKS